jgi:hypothetical protein
LDTNNAATVLKLAQVAIIDLCYSYTLYGWSYINVHHVKHHSYAYVYQLFICIRKYIMRIFISYHKYIWRRNSYSQLSFIFIDYIYAYRQSIHMHSNHIFYAILKLKQFKFCSLLKRNGTGKKIIRIATSLRIYT